MLLMKLVSDTICLRYHTTSPYLYIHVHLLQYPTHVPRKSTLESFNRIKCQIIEKKTHSD